ncbi:hypothetical protein M0802_006231 [Mischocyttarus mexicanus]|nr:hypothetical protein M0802_006231 [Mischocyttarus mexicanus]
MKASNFSPTLKQRRKFEHIEETNMDDRNDTSSVNNHNSDLCKIGKLCASINQKIQTLTDSSKESIDKCFLQEEKMDIIDPNNVTSVQKNNINTMNKTIMKIIHCSIVVFTITGSFVPLFLSVYLDHVRLNFIYISETAYNFPELSIFSQSLNLIVAFGIPCMYLRYRILDQFIQDKGENIIIKCLKYISNISSIVVLVGINLIANYPMFGITYKIHTVGVITYIFAATTFSITQTLFTLNMIDIVTNIYIYYTRVIISILLVISQTLFIIPGQIASLLFQGNDKRNWDRNDGGWLFHVISVIGEWVHTLLFSIFIFTLIYEFHTIRVEMPVIKITYFDKKEKKELNDKIAQDAIVQ